MVYSLLVYIISSSTTVIYYYYGPPILVVQTVSRSFFRVRVSRFGHHTTPDRRVHLCQFIAANVGRRETNMRQRALSASEARLDEILWAWGVLNEPIASNIKKKTQARALIGLLPTDPVTASCAIPGNVILRTVPNCAWYLRTMVLLLEYNSINDRNKVAYSTCICDIANGTRTY